MSFIFFQNIGPENLAITTDIAKFYDFSLNLMIAFGVTFQIPLLINAIISGGLIPKNELSAYRGIFLIVCFFVGMIFTPPDIISQIFLAVPMYILFELGLTFTNEKKT
jgi:sec-independent protein translocase protein TatC